MQFQGKNAQRCTWRKVNAARVITAAFYCDDVKGGFEKYKNIGDGICGIIMLKQNMKERNWKYQQKPQEDEQKPLKTLWLNSSCEAEEKITVRKTN